jgi:hypothetical protein
VDVCTYIFLMLTKEYQSQIRLKDSDCLSLFIQMIYSSFSFVQKCAANLLVILSFNKECAEVIEKDETSKKYIQTNYYNQNGQLKKISEIRSLNSNTLAILQHINNFNETIT